MLGLFDFIGEVIDAARSETKNPNLFQHAELDRHQEEIWAACGGQHGLVEAVKGQPHTYEVGGRRIKIEDGVVKRV